MARARRRQLTAGVETAGGITIVLVRPEAPVNVGAAARAMRNAGLEDLRLVLPGDWRTIECWRTAWGAHAVLEQAREFPDIASALADASWTVAFSGKRRSRGAAGDVLEAARDAVAQGANGRAALVFGPETSGLTEAEIDLCGRSAVIPAHEAQPSLNLGQAVMVACYEVLRAQRTAPPPEAPLAPHDEVQRMLGLLREGLLAIGGLPADRADFAFNEWTALFQRARLTPREARLLTHMARRMVRPHGEDRT
jgi:tRNA/rRNA methyltransferase